MTDSTATDRVELEGMVDAFFTAFTSGEGTGGGEPAATPRKALRTESPSQDAE